METGKRLIIGLSILLLLVCGGLLYCHQRSEIPVEEITIGKGTGEKLLNKSILYMKSYQNSLEEKEIVKEKAEGDIHITEGAGYRLCYNCSLFTYSYQIFSSKNEILEEAADVHANIYIEDRSEKIVSLAISAGTGVRQEWFFDRETGEKSELFFNVEAVNGTTIVYMTRTEKGEICLVIRDMFDKNILYKEIQRDFSSTAVPCYDLLEARFLDDSTLEIVYKAGEDYEDVKEIIIIE